MIEIEIIDLEVIQTSLLFAISIGIAILCKRAIQE